MTAWRSLPADESKQMKRLFSSKVQRSGGIREACWVKASTGKRCNQETVNSKKVLHRAQIHRRLWNGAVRLESGINHERVGDAVFVQMPETIRYPAVGTASALVLNEDCQPLRRTEKEMGHEMRGET